MVRTINRLSRPPPRAPVAGPPLQLHGVVRHPVFCFCLECLDRVLEGVERRQRVSGGTTCRASKTLRMGKLIIKGSGSAKSERKVGFPRS